MDSDVLIFFLVVLLILLIWGLICAIPSKMARSRGRSYWGWFLFSFFFSPLLSIIILACLGDTEERRKEKIYEAEEIRLSLERRYSRQENSNEENSTQNPQIPNPTGKTINDLYKQN
jgi:hypothetical protein